MNCVYRRFTQFSAAMLCRRRPVWTTTSLDYRRHRPNRDAELVEGMGDFDEEDLVQRRGQEEVLFDSVRVDGSEWMRRTDERFEQGNSFPETLKYFKVKTKLNYKIIL